MRIIVVFHSGEYSGDLLEADGGGGNPVCNLHLDQLVHALDRPVEVVLVVGLRRRHQGQGLELHAPGAEQALPQARHEQQQPEALQGPQRDVYVM